jgi:hypothetical protein
LLVARGPVTHIFVPLYYRCSRIFSDTRVAIRLSARPHLVLTSCSLALVLRPGTRDAEEADPDLLGSALTALGTGGRVYGIIEGSDKGLGEARAAPRFRDRHRRPPH